jgi:hypothetical protein
MRQVIEYESDDGKRFPTADEARAHEDMLAFEALVDLDRDELSAALQRKPGFETISDALEKAGAKIAKARREAGELKRERRAKEEPAAEPQSDQEAPAVSGSADELEELIATDPRSGERRL